MLWGLLSWFLQVTPSIMQIDRDRGPHFKNYGRNHTDRLVAGDDLAVFFL